MTSEVLILLGAGASMDAGLPSNFALTDRLIESLPVPEQQIYYFVIGVMHAEMGKAGEDPSQKVSAERVAAMIEMLASRRTLAISPFIQQWDPAIGTFNSEVRRRRSPTREFRRAVEDMLKPLWSQVDEHQGVLQKLSKRQDIGRLRSPSKTRRDSADKFWRAVQTLLDEELPEGQDRFAAAASATRLELPSVLAVDDVTDLSYLDPIFELHAQRKVDTVVTLNYDLTLETAAARRGVAVARGIERWSERTALNFDRGHLRLLKLHGSIDWVRRVSDRQEGQGEGASGSGTPPDDGLSTAEVRDRKLRYPREWIEIHDQAQGGKEPHLIFGEGSKLQVEGPFLDLLTQFRAELDRVDALVVVGYSFRDAHVNAYIRKWLAADRSHQLHVVDPGFGGSSAVRPLSRSHATIGLSGTDFEVDLQQLLFRDGGDDAQVTFHRATARNGLPRVLDVFR